MVIYLDGADLKTMAELESKVEGFTTNPSLMKKSGVTKYKDFAKEVLQIAQGKPVSFEVLADDPGFMLEQAEELSSWGKNVYVKIPITNSVGDSTADLICVLVDMGVRVNVTAVFTPKQAYKINGLLTENDILSVFAGRIADAGQDPMAAIRVMVIQWVYKPAKILWASAREVYNVKQAEQAGCDIITLSPELVRKLDLFGKDLEQYSLETVQQFKRDAEGISF